jgi:hypothetical protein
MGDGLFGAEETGIVFDPREARGRGVVRELGRIDGVAGEPTGALPATAALTPGAAPLWAAHGWGASPSATLASPWLGAKGEEIGDFVTVFSDEIK